MNTSTEPPSSPVPPPAITRGQGRFALALPGKGVVVLLLLAMALVPVLGCQARDQNQRTIVIGSFKISFAGLIVVAREKGYFTRRGINLVHREFNSGLAAIEALSRGEIDMAYASDMAFAALAIRDESLRIIASIASVNTCEVVARKQSGIATPGDLRGKKIGYAPQTAGHYFLTAFLTRNAISSADVEHVRLPPESLAEALASRRIDAASIGDPVAFTVKKLLGEELVAWWSQGGQDYYGVVAAKQGFALSRAKDIDGFLSALLDAESFIRENEVEAMEIIYNYWGYNPDIADYVWVRIKPSVALSQALVISLEAAVRWQAERVPKSPLVPDNTLHFISMDGLNRVAPDRVTIFR